MTDLGEVLPALDEQVKLTWLMRDLAARTADVAHEELLKARSGTEQDLVAFKKALATYAGWVQCTAALNHELDKMNCGQRFTDEPVFKHYPKTEEDELLNLQANLEVTAGAKNLVSQWEAILQTCAPQKYC